ncbi:Alcohol dehydrogenase [NADP(+)] [Stylophora pistillata]|uniref:Alcohol dehydrogenase [NADP(+)] n=1 Tax=Stylophora pistillata TaxID=50429 RepID=A0A2B4SIL8_STYPI|nr:Alcohol dehydrogenase [NADP(+)] [Stylophora pistillata]
MQLSKGMEQKEGKPIRIYVNREGLLITSKLWNTKHNHGDVLSAAEQTLSDLGLNFLDLYLMHWPVLFEDGDINFPKDGDGNIIYADHDPCDTWKAMESLVDHGLVKAVGGMSSFNQAQLIEHCRNRDIVGVFEY